MKQKIVKGLIAFIIIISFFNVLLYFGIGSNVVNGSYNVATSGYHFVVDGTTNFFDTIKSKNELATQNKLLQDQVDSLEGEILNLNSQIEQLTIELNTLEASNVYTNVETVKADVIMRNIMDWQNKLTINVGEDDGIAPGMAVLSNGTIVGTISSVDKNTSQVDLMSSENVALNIPAYGLRGSKEKNGIIKSYDSSSNTYKFQTLSQLDILEVGDMIYTNGYQEGIPKGLVIGQVVDIENGTLGNEYYVAPTTDIQNMRYVEVVTDVQ